MIRFAESVAFGILGAMILLVFLRYNGSILHLGPDDYLCYKMIK